MVGFISGMIDSDGEVRIKNGIVRISNTDTILVKKLLKYFKALGIRVKLEKYAYKNHKNWSDLYKITVPIKFINCSNNSVKIKRLKHFTQRSGNL